MVASRETTRTIYTILELHLSKEQIEGVLGDLIEVPGNKSFRDTVENLLLIHRLRQTGVLERESHRSRKHT